MLKVMWTQETCSVVDGVRDMLKVMWTQETCSVVDGVRDMLKLHGLKRLVQ